MASPSLGFLLVSLLLTSLSHAFFSPLLSPSAKPSHRTPPRTMALSSTVCRPKKTLLWPQTTPSVASRSWLRSGVKSMSSVPTLAQRKDPVKKVQSNCKKMRRLGGRGVRNQVQMTYVELLGKSRINPRAIYGDLDILITRVQFDSREVYHKDLFTSCVRLKTDGILYLTWACNRGAIALVVGEESATDSALPVIIVTFYGHPSRSLFVVGVIGTNGKMTMTNLV
ncbi:hypothetical protein GW17_00052120 [Ensete ventricosum]|nr:hypothetical protein GW17_00052120 [Ensete ventricosum]